MVCPHVSLGHRHLPTTEHDVACVVSQHIIRAKQRGPRAIVARDAASNFVQLLHIAAARGRMKVRSGLQSTDCNVVAIGDCQLSVVMLQTQQYGGLKMLLHNRER